MKKIYIISLCTLLLFNVLKSQSRNELSSNYKYYNNKLVTVATFIEKSNPDSFKLHLFYKLPINNYLLKQTSTGNFLGIANFTFTLSDKDGVVRFHSLFNDTIISSKSQFSQTETDFKKGYTTFSIPNQNYSMEIRVSDGNSKKSERLSVNYIINDTTRKLNGSLLFLNKRTENQYDPVCLLNNSNYSKTSKALVINLLGSVDYQNLTYKIKKIENEDEYNLTMPEINGKVEKIRTNEVKFDNQLVEFNFNPKVSREIEETGQFYYLIDFIHNPFVPGQYQLDLSSNNRIIFSTNFKVIWDDQPISLHNINVALKISEIFLTKSEIDKIRSVNRKYQFKELFNIWKSLDKTTPMDNFSEAMMEFYSRADYAYYNFATFAERNGALTDKGKVYILNGPPDKIEEEFKMKKLNEKWTYSNLIKEYTFESIEAGVFKLVNIKE